MFELSCKYFDARAVCSRLESGSPELQSASISMVIKRTSTEMELEMMAGSKIEQIIVLEKWVQTG